MAAEVEAGIGGGTRSTSTLAVGALERLSLTPGASAAVAITIPDVMVALTG